MLGQLAATLNPRAISQRERWGYVVSADKLKEMRDEYVSTMGDDLGRVFFAIHHEAIDLGIVWQQYTQLYGTDAETIQVLNGTAGLFFRVIQDELWDSVLLRISALTDPAQTRNNKNISVCALPPLIQDPAKKSEVQRLCALALAETEYAREHRNKRIAHNDHDYHVKKGAEGAVELGGISRKKVEEMLCAIRNVLKYVQSELRDVDFLYDRFIEDTGAGLLIKKLKKARA